MQSDSPRNGKKFSPLNFRLHRRKLGTDPGYFCLLTTGFFLGRPAPPLDTIEKRGLAPITLSKVPFGVTS